MRFCIWKSPPLNYEVWIPNFIRSAASLLRIDMGSLITFPESFHSRQSVCPQQGLQSHLHLQLELSEIPGTMSALCSVQLFVEPRISKSLCVSSFAITTRNLNLALSEPDPSIWSQHFTGLHWPTESGNRYPTVRNIWDLEPHKIWTCTRYQLQICIDN
jgi:hypothetical protein